MIRSRDLDNRRFVFSKKESILLLLHYFVGYTFLYPIIVKEIDALIFKTVGGIHPKLFTAFMIFMILSSVAIVYQPLKRSFNFFKGNLKENLIKIFKNFGWLFLANMVINIIFVYVFKITETSENQVQIEAMIRGNVVAMFLSTVVFAPIVEELVFRGVLYQNLRSKKGYFLPMLFSVLIFGSMHLISGLMAGNGLFEFVYLIQYAAMALFMISAMEDTNNICGAMGVHFFNNFLAFSAVLLTATVLI